MLLKLDLSMRFRGIKGDNFVLEMPEDERNDIAALVFGVAEKIDHLDTYANVTPDVAQQVGVTMRDQKEEIFEISQNHLRALFSITMLIGSRALDPQKLASIPQKRYDGLYEGVKRTRDVVIQLEAKTLKRRRKQLS